MVIGILVLLYSKYGSASNSAANYHLRVQAYRFHDVAPIFISCYLFSTGIYRLQIVPDTVFEYFNRRNRCRCRSGIGIYTDQRSADGGVDKEFYQKVEFANAIFFFEK